MRVSEKIVMWRTVHAAGAGDNDMEALPAILEVAEIPVPPLEAGEVLVAVAGCGVCFANFKEVDDRGPGSRPLALSGRYEFSGTVVSGHPDWVGREVLVPAVLPCGSCRFCRAGSFNRCLDSRKPVAASGRETCFSSHVRVSAADLVEIAHRRASLPLEHLAGVLDAVGPCVHAARLAGVSAGDTVIVVGQETLGPWMVQAAQSFGAATVIAVNTLETRPEILSEYGASHIIHVPEKAPGEAIGQVKALVERARETGGGCKVVETSTDPFGLEIARALLGSVDRVVVLGTRAAAVKWKMDRLEANETQAIGTWGCLPEDYPCILEQVTSGRIAIGPFLLTRPMSWLPEVLRETKKSVPGKRLILTTDDFGLEYDFPAMSCR